MRVQFKICRLLLIIISQMLCVNSIYAQNRFMLNLDNALKIGDVFVPPAESPVMRGEIESIDWNSLTDKIIVFDFFDTYCTTCIASMPHLQELRDAHSDIVQIFNVTWQERETLEDFFSNNGYIKEHKVRIPVLYADTALKNRFPFKAAPHVVMIYQGRVQAITYNRLLTAENIMRLHTDGKIDLPLKNDFGEKLNLLPANHSDAVDDRARATLLGYRNGYPAKSLIMERDSMSGLTHSSITNRSIYRALINTWANIEPRAYFITDQRVEWNVRDSTIYRDFDEIGEAWDSHHAISYERIDYVARDKVAQAKVILQDLHSFLGVRSYWANRLKACWVLQSCQPKGKHVAPVDGTVQLDGTDSLAKFIGMSGRYPLTEDQVKRSIKLAIGPFRTRDELNEQLRPFGLEVVEGTGEFEVLVIEEEL